MTRQPERLPFTFLNDVIDVMAVLLLSRDSSPRGTLLALRTHHGARVMGAPSQNSTPTTIGHDSRIRHAHHTNHDSTHTPHHPHTPYSPPHERHHTTLDVPTPYSPPHERRVRTFTTFPGERRDFKSRPRPRSFARRRRRRSSSTHRRRRRIVVVIVRVRRAPVSTLSIHRFIHIKKTPRKRIESESSSWRMNSCA